MAMTKIIGRRLLRLINYHQPRLKLTWKKLGKNPAFGKPPLGYDEKLLAELLDLINSNVGFNDLLAKNLAANELTPSKKYNEVVAVIHKKRNVKTFNQYRDRMLERSRVALQTALIDLSEGSLQKEDLDFKKDITEYLSRKITIPKLTRALNTDLRRYLISDIIESNIKGSLDKVRRTIVFRRMLVR
jgi:hypothetical protein